MSPTGALACPSWEVVTGRVTLLLSGPGKNCTRVGVRSSGSIKGRFPDSGASLLQSTRSTPSSSTPSSRPASLGYSGAAGPRPITQSELATALALASTPESSSHTPTPGTQVWRQGGKVVLGPQGRSPPAVEWVCPFDPGARSGLS